MSEIAFLIVISLPFIFILNPHLDLISVGLTLPLSPRFLPLSPTIRVLGGVSDGPQGICSSQAAVKMSLVFVALLSPGATLAMPPPCWVPGSLQGGLGFVCMNAPHPL